MTSTESLLSISLLAAVPLWQLRMQERSWNVIQGRLPYIVDMIASHGDNILFRSKKQGDTAAAFNALAEGLAILSFVPGGVKVFGQHWEATHLGPVSMERLQELYRVLSALERRDPDRADSLKKRWRK